MKRDMDLIRALLLKLEAEATDRGFSFEEAEAETLKRTLDEVRYKGASKNTPSARPANQIQRIEFDHRGAGEMGQLGFFDLSRRYEGLDVKDDPLFRATGSAAPGKMGGHRPRVLTGECRTWLLQRIASGSDMTLRGLYVLKTQSL